MSQPEALSYTVTSQFHDKCSTTTYSTSKQFIRSGNLTQLSEKGAKIGISRISKSESPQILSQSQDGSAGAPGFMTRKDTRDTKSKMCQSDATCQQSQTTSQSKTRKSSSTKLSDSAQSSPNTPNSPQEKGEVKKSLFSFTVGDTFVTSSSTVKEASSSGNSSKKSLDPSVVVDKAELRRLSSAQEKSTRRGRFKKILNPLRRSQSAGCTKDVPAHALFLRHDMDLERRKSQVSRSSVFIRSSAHTLK